MAVGISGVTALAVLLCALFIHVQAQFSPCRYGWKQFGQSCYLFSSQSASWPEAEAYCMSFGGYLTEINNQAENDFLKMILHEYNTHGGRRRGSKSPNSYWIGGDDIEVENHFTWSRSNTPIVFTDWNETQPDDTNINEDCMELRQEFNYRWNDLFCTISQRFICEMPMKFNGGDIVG